MGCGDAEGCQGRGGAVAPRGCGPGGGCGGAEGQRSRMRCGGAEGQRLGEKIVTKIIVVFMGINVILHLKFDQICDKG